MDINELKANLKAAGAELAQITETAKAAERDLTETERAKATGLADHIFKLRALVDEAEQKSAPAGNTIDPDSDDFAAFQKALFNASGEAGADVDAPYFGDVGAQLGLKAADTILGAKGQGFKALDPAGSLDLRTRSLKVAETSRRERWLAQLVGGDPLVIGTGQFPILRQTVRTNNADVVAPGGAKPYSVYSTEQVMIPMRTVAHVSEPIERQLLEDHKNLAGFVNSEMVFGVATSVDNQIVNGDGTGENMEGILATSGVQAQAFATDAPTTLRKARTKLENIGKEIGDLVVVMNPDDIEALDLAQGTDNHFKNIANVEENGITRVFGVRVFPTPVIAAGTAIVGDFSSAEFHLRTDGVQILWRETGTATYNAAPTDLFEHNLVQVRGEVRAGVGIKRPGDFVVADLTGV